MIKLKLIFINVLKVIFLFLMFVLHINSLNATYYSRKLQTNKANVKKNNQNKLFSKQKFVRYSGASVLLSDANKLQSKSVDKNKLHNNLNNKTKKISKK